MNNEVTRDGDEEKAALMALERIDAIVRQRDMARSGEQAAHDLLAKALAKVDELTQQRDEAGKRVNDLLNALCATGRQCDELAACLQDFMDGFGNGAFIVDFRNDDYAATTEYFMGFVARCQAALLRLDVRERLDDKLQAERKETVQVLNEAVRKAFP